MSRLEAGLIVLLILQILMWVGGEFSTPERSARAEQSKILVSVDPGSVSRVEFQNEENALSMYQDGSIWRSLGDEQFPVDQQQVTAFLGKLAGLKRGLAVSVSSSSHSRFKVAESNHVLKLVLKPELGEEIVLFLGNSASVRESYARVAGESPVYTVDIESWELSSLVDHWLNKKYLEWEGVDVRSIHFNGLSFDKVDADFHLRDSEGGNYDLVKIRKFLEELSKFRVESFVFSDVAAKKALLFEELVVIKIRDGTEIKLLMASIVEDDKTKYFVKRSDRDGVYKVSSYQIEKILDVKPERFKITLADS